MDIRDRKNAVCRVVGGKFSPCRHPLNCGYFVQKNTIGARYFREKV